jgi:hypothetical protein
MQYRVKAVLTFEVEYLAVDLALEPALATAKEALWGTQIASPELDECGDPGVVITGIALENDE